MDGNTRDARMRGTLGESDSARETDIKKTQLHTEHSVLAALRKRYEKRANANPEWMFLDHVRNRAGHDATRTLDAMALGLWPSRGMELQGFEVKVSLADFRRELETPEKMDAFAHVLDRFWIVAPAGVVPVAEIPATWGSWRLSLTAPYARKRPPLCCERGAPIYLASCWFR